ncbi:MFS transporter [Acidocella sp.]|jgi:ACS family glucarate transporter-like MFS transporter|uniref:MFS transporter n=1 Tax=Acidocella sp. TaxID=50710 RepID=UPI002F3EA55D
MTTRRIWVVLLIFTLVVVNYMDRVALSIAAHPIATEFHLSPVQMGYLFSSFLWTYVICLVPLGVLVERSGAKRMVACGIALWSLATAATALAWGFTSVLVARLVMGASEASSYPSCGRVVRDWIPERERGVVTTLFNGGSTAGPAIGALVAATLISHIGWRATFVALGVVGFVWLAFWQFRFDQPERASWLPEAERSMILETRNGQRDASEAAPSAILYLLRQRTVWGLVIAQACVVYTAYLLMTWLPTYLQTTRHVSLQETGYLTSAAYFCALVIGLGIARVSDRMLSSTAILNGGRRIFTAGLAAISLVILAAPHAGSLFTLMVILVVVLTGSTTASGINFAIASDVLRNPRDVSRVTSIVAFGGNSFGLAAPIMTGYAVSITGGYTVAFRIAAALLLCGVIAVLTMVRRPVHAENGADKMPAEFPELQIT